ncbi:MAG: BamA/TamA family outer membrane protein [Rufibacter sp.]
MLGLLFGCSPTRHLTGNERLLWKINLEGVEQNEKSAITPLYQQRPNRRVLGMPLYLNLYYLGKSFYNPERIQANINEETEDFNRKIANAGNDSLKVDDLIEKKEKRLAKLQNKKENGNWLMRTVGEPPAIFDSLKLVQTQAQVELYLQSKGFFRSSVSASTEVDNKKVMATLQVREDRPYLITQHTLEVPDTSITRLLKVTHVISHIKPGQNYDEARLSQERDRIEGLLRNNGFFDFRQQFVTFEADTSYAPYTVRITTKVANPSDTSFHKVYKINKVDFIADAGLNRFGISRDTILLNNVYYLAYDHRIKPRILNRKVIIRPGQTYSATRTLDNQRILNNLDMFKYTTINYTKRADTVNTEAHYGLLDAQINTAMLPRYQETTELGLTYTERVPGPYSSIRLRVRNVFGGAEIFDVGVRAGIEGQLQRDETKTGTRKEVGADMGLTFPQILLPFRNNNVLVRYSPRTRLSTGYTYVDRTEYTRTNLDFSIDYIWQRLNIHQYSFSPIDVSIISTPRISPDFTARLNEFAAQGNPLRESFNNAFVSTINFTSLYNTANYNQSNNAKLVRLFVESGGLLGQYFAKALPSLKSYKFVKASLDYRRYHPLGNNLMFVYRANGGLASPLGGYKALPYDKYFFAGGPSSIRAWLPRRLGPGSSARLDTSSYAVTYRFEQPGEILLELNSEFRFRMFRFGITNVNGAVFFDAGNVWLFRERETTTGSEKAATLYQPGAEFRFNRFYKELAMGTGFGIRFDFSFAVLRFDIATKVHDPALPEGKRFVLDRFSLTNILSNTNQTTFNLGIGYPF